MQTRHLGQLGPVSELTLGGGGVGQLWGATTQDECIATVRAAVDHGITLLDMAPAYGDGEAEVVVGAAFEGRLPEGVRVTTKHRLGTPASDAVAGNLVRSLDDSLARMRLERVDVLFLHSNIIPDDYDASAYTDRPATRWTTYADAFVPACEKLVAEGRIGAWGVTGIGIPDCILRALDGAAKPAVVQCLSNPIDSAGELQYFSGPSRARELIAATQAAGAGVMAQEDPEREERRQRRGDLVSIFTEDILIPENVDHSGMIFSLGGNVVVDGSTREVVVILGDLRVTGEVRNQTVGVLTRMELDGAEIFDVKLLQDRNPLGIDPFLVGCFAT